MNWRLVRASARLELQRNWPMVFRLLLTIAVCGVLAAFGPRAVMYFAALVSGAMGTVTACGGALTAIKERHLGRVAWWRTLPASRFDLAAGRLLGAGVLGIGFGLGLVPVVTLGIREGMLVPGPAAILLLFAVASIAGFGLATLTTGLALRFRLERIFLGFFLLSILLGDRFETMMEGTLGAFGRWIVATASGSTALLLPALALVVAIAGWCVGIVFAQWGFATATDTATNVDVSGISKINWRHVRYPSGQRGPVRATLLLQLRLAAERLPQQLGYLILGGVLVPIVPEQVAMYLVIYLPFIALSIPAAVVGRTASARMTGTIEGYATLPVRREWLALGTVLAIALLAMLATGAVVVFRMTSDRAMGAAAIFALWGLTTGGTSLANGMAAWFKPKYMPIVIVVALIAMVAIATIVLPVIMSPVPIGNVSGTAPLQLVVGAIGLLLIAPLGGALYGHGLERFELVRK